ncbi:MAG: acyl-CoA/acyl-ACP dehydrogenase [Sulfuricurvum sp.]|uniref:acyl-CoA dehydrogenase family protein n=1 Tax=Sulfuricurvum sp. TaxID=2025608 RepID=UPI0025CBA0A4|nr:acyl-CoA dehydrogenase family protein [Sulfuricurvum sp.]MBV5320668.1 acyl-CoA/acyl-ACP dehydrogenase [Sulfuricurvum sp.]
MGLFEEVSAFAQCHVAPYTVQADREGVFPKEAYTALKKEGYTGLLVPKEYGGASGSIVDHVETCMALGSVCATTALCYMMHNVATMSIVAFGTSEQKEFYLPKIASGELALALAFSETGTGTHFYNPEIKAVKTENGYLLNGKKSFVTSAHHADYYLVLAANPEGEGLSVFATPNTMEGMRHDDSAWDGLGMRGNASVPVYYENVAISDDHLVGAHGDGVGIVFNVVAPFFILGLASVYTGLSLAASGCAIEYASSRAYTDGSTLSQIETVQLHIAALFSSASASKALTLNAAQAALEGRSDALALIISARLEASTNAVDVCSRAMKVGGGHAYSKRLPLERYLRDAYAAAVMAPSTDVLSVWLGKALTGQQIP